VGIGLAVISLTYILLLVMSYQFFIFINEKDDKRSCIIITKSYQYAYSILLFGILVIYALVVLPHIHLDSQTISYLVLASKFMSMVTLAGSIYLLSKKFK
jgi:hypothetical protein